MRPLQGSITTSMRKAYKTRAKQPERDRARRIFSCPSCDKTFKGGDHLANHQKSTGHQFRSPQRLPLPFGPHGDDTRTVHPNFARTAERELSLTHEGEAARGCNSVTLSTIEQKQVASGSKPKTVNTPRCKPCRRYFRDHRALHDHQKSRRHTSPRILSCPLSPQCTSSFPLCSRLFQHWESGKCASGMDRVKLNAIFESVPEAWECLTGPWDWDAVLTSFLSMITRRESWQHAGHAAGLSSPPDSDWTDIDTSTETMSDSSTSAVLISLKPRSAKISSHRRSWEDEWIAHYEQEPSCLSHTRSLSPVDDTWTCRYCGRTFAKECALLQHLDSPVHTPAFIACPMEVKVRRRSRRRRSLTFNTLSGLIQHLESGACPTGPIALRLIAGFVNGARCRAIE